MKRKPAGRPWKYWPLVETLDDEELYHVKKIIHHAEAHGLFDNDLDEPSRNLDEIEQRRARSNARSALANMASRRLGQPDGEVEVRRPYRAFYPAWYGKTWKALK